MAEVDVGHVAHRAGLFLCDSEALYSFSGALHSVLISAAKAKRLRNACSAEWMASAGIISLPFINSRMALGISIHNPVVSRSQLGVSRSTTSRILSFLPRRWALHKRPI